MEVSEGRAEEEEDEMAGEEAIVALESREGRSGRSCALEEQEKAEGRKGKKKKKGRPRLVFGFSRRGRFKSRPLFWVSAWPWGGSCRR